MKKKYFLLAALVLILFSLFPCAAASTVTVTIEPYTQDEFPDWAKDLRRTEIISFGAMPFVTLTSTIVYSFGRYACSGFSSTYFPNPLAKSSDGANLSQQEQLWILGASAGISLVIGLVDLGCNIYNRNKHKALELDKAAKTGIQITTVSPEQNGQEFSEHPLSVPSDEKEIVNETNDSAAASPETISSTHPQLPDSLPAAEGIR